MSTPDPAVKEVLTAPVRPLAEAFSVYVLGAVKIRLPNVARPLIAVAVAVTPAGFDETVTAALEPVRFPKLSRICTLAAGVSATPSPPLGGCCRNASLLAAAAAMLKEAPLPFARPAEVAVKL